MLTPEQEPRRKPNISIREGLLRAFSYGEEVESPTSHFGRWVTNNLLSTRRVARSGEHQVVYYPACGSDVVRAAIAFDAQETIGVDSYPEVRDEVIMQLDQSGFRYQILVKSDTVLKISLHLPREKQPKIITLVTEDARLYFDRQAKANQKADVWYVFLPTGADQDLPADDQPDTEVQPVPGIKRYLNPAAYMAINEGGFLAFQEDPAIRNHYFPNLLALMGLKERTITGRHPYTVSTSFSATETQLKEMDQHRFLLQKIKAVGAEQLKVGLTTLEGTNSLIALLGGIEQGHFNFFNWASDMSDLLDDESSVETQPPNIKKNSHRVYKGLSS